VRAICAVRAKEGTKRLQIIKKSGNNVSGTLIATKFVILFIWIILDFDRLLLLIVKCLGIIFGPNKTQISLKTRPWCSESCVESLVTALVFSSGIR